MDDAIAVRRRPANGVQIGKCAELHFRTKRPQRLGLLAGASESDGLVAAVDELRDDGGTDESGRARDEYAHGCLQIRAWLPDGRHAMNDVSYCHHDRSTDDSD